MVLWKSELEIFLIFFFFSSLFTKFILSITFYMRNIYKCYCLLNFLCSFWSASDPSVLLLYDRLALFLSLSSVSNTRFIAAVIERHTHSPERRRRYWGRSGTESDHGKHVSVHSSLKL